MVVAAAFSSAAVVLKSLKISEARTANSEK
jgi:hypothetical protein